MAVLYCLPLNDTIVKIGSHLGNEKKLDTRYGTYVCKEHLEQKVVIPVEPENRLIFEQALHALIRRHNGVHKEKEKYTIVAKDLFLAYAGVYALRNEQKTIGKAVSKTVSNETETDRLYNQMREEKRLQKIAEHEHKKKQAVHDMIKGLVGDIVDTAISQIPDTQSIKTPLFEFLSNNTKVRYEEGAETYLSDVKRAYQDHLGTPVTSKLDLDTFTQIDARWRVNQPKVCKICHQKHSMQPKCCDQASVSSKTSGRMIIYNLKLLCV